jgi:regulator of replication initiation timing
MGRRPRDQEADRAAIQAAAERLLAGTPLRSRSGRLTASELITECDLRRDIVYRHTDLVQDFQARAKAQDSTPTAMQELADENRTLKAEADDLRDELRQERARTKTMRMIIAELSLELEQAKAELEGASGIARLPDRR